MGFSENSTPKSHAENHDIVSLLNGYNLEYATFSDTPKIMCIYIILYI